jgi:hypothetical protein
MGIRMLTIGGRSLLLPFPCSLGLLNQFFLAVCGMLNLVLGFLSEECSAVIPAVENARKKSAIPDNLRNVYTLVRM